MSPVRSPPVMRRFAASTFAGALPRKKTSSASWFSLTSTKSSPYSAASRTAPRRRSSRQVSSASLIAADPLHNMVVRPTSGCAPHESLGVRLLGPPDHVFHRHEELRVLRPNLEVVQVDEIAEMALQGRLGRELQGGSELGAVWCEHHLQEAAAEIRPVQAL